MAISLQIFWQKFYRNVPWIVLYQSYKFCPNRWIWLVAMATKMLNLWTNIKKSSPQKPLGGWSWNFADMFITLAFTTIMFFYCHCSCAFVPMATYSFHRLIMGKVKVGLYFYLTADILTKVFPWVVLFQIYEFCPNCWIWLVAMFFIAIAHVL